MVLADIAPKRLDFPTFDNSKGGFSNMVVGFSCHAMLDFPAGVLFFPPHEIPRWLGPMQHFFG